MLNLKQYVTEIEPVDKSYGEKARQREDILTKPQGSLGRLETLAVAIASMTRQEVPNTGRKTIFTFAGDHGVVEEGVSAFPQEVTPQMVANFIHDGAAINVLARQAGADIIVADLGVAVDLNIDHPKFRDRKVSYGTRNFTKEPAMTEEDAYRAITAGIEIFEEEHQSEPITLAATGEMGIGNTTAATAILAVIGGGHIEKITGRGTGIDDNGIIRKISAIKRAIEIHRPDETDGLDVLRKVGGFEIAGLAGVILAAARHRIPVLIDGFISTSAALIANLLQPLAAQYMLAAHLSEEQGHKKMLDILGKEPILNLGLRLGEGTGAALAMHVVEASLRILNEMATFESAGVAGKG